jgi:hypothetical protein
LSRCKWSWGYIGARTPNYISKNNLVEGEGEMRGEEGEQSSRLAISSLQYTRSHNPFKKKKKQSPRFSG